MLYLDLRTPLVHLQWHFDQSCFVLCHMIPYKHYTVSMILLRSKRCRVSIILFLLISIFVVVYHIIVNIHCDLSNEYPWKDGVIPAVYQHTEWDLWHSLFRGSCHSVTVATKWKKILMQTLRYFIFQRFIFEVLGLIINSIGLFVAFLGIHLLNLKEIHDVWNIYLRRRCFALLPCVWVTQLSVMWLLVPCWSPWPQSSPWRRLCLRWTIYSAHLSASSSQST